MNYITQLNVHSDYELGQSLIKIDDYIDFAKKNKLKAIALTDDSILSGAVEFYQKAVENGIKPIIGTKFNICKNSAESGRKKTLSEILLYAKNNEGFENLIQLSNYANTKGNFEKFRIDFNVLSKYSEGLICVTYELLPNKTNSQLIEQIKKYENIFGEDLYIGLNEDEINIRNEHFINLINIAKKLKIKPVITCEARYFKNNEFPKFNSFYSERLDYDRPNKEYLWGYFHYRSLDELRKIYHFLDSKQFNEYISNIDEIIQKCNVDLEKFYDFSKLPKYDTPKSYTSQDYLEELVKKGIAERYSKITDEIKNRYEYELQVIKQKNLADYFLIVWDYIKYAKENNIPYGLGRGYATCSVICYALEITHIDPIKNNLYFERFLNPETDTLPSINIDVGASESKNLLKYINQKYENQTVKISTHVTFSPVANFMWICRLYDIPYSECKTLCKMLKSSNKTSLKDIIKLKSSKFKKLYDENYTIKTRSGEDVSLRKIVHNAIIYEGLKDKCGTISAGSIISPKKLDCTIPLRYNMFEELIAQYPIHIMDNLGYTKFNIIPNRYISFINDVANSAGIELGEISIDDNSTYDLITKGETKDIYTLCTNDCIKYVKELKPENFEQFCTFLALFREKPIKNGLMKEYIERKNGKSFEYISSELQSVLESTYGILVYEEQVIEIIRKLTKCTFAKADILRNDIKKEIFDKKSFINTLTKNGYDKTFASHITKLLTEDGSFAYSKSHAIGYTMQIYYMAYLRAHYPKIFAEYK